MAKQRLFEYAILYHPRPIRAKEGEAEESPKSEVLKDVTRILAKDEQEVGMLAAREIPDTYLSKLENVEIIVRPF